MDERIFCFEGTGLLTQTEDQGFHTFLQRTSSDTTGLVVSKTIINEETIDLLGRLKGLIKLRLREVEFRREADLRLREVCSNLQVFELYKCKRRGRHRLDMITTMSRLETLILGLGVLSEDDVNHINLRPNGADISLTLIGHGAANYYENIGSIRNLKELTFENCGEMMLNAVPRNHSYLRSVSFKRGDSLNVRLDEFEEGNRRLPMLPSRVKRIEIRNFDRVDCAVCMGLTWRHGLVLTHVEMDMRRCQELIDISYFPNIQYCELVDRLTTGVFQ